jgi:hypothetical protein
METLGTAVGAVFVAAFAVQQLLELVDPVFFKEDIVQYKKLILDLVSLALGIVLAFGFGLRMMAPFGVNTVDWLDATVTAIVLSAGTEGSNSIMKVLQYYKENLKHAEADGGEKKKSWLVAGCPAAVFPDPIRRIRSQGHCYGSIDHFAYE